MLQMLKMSPAISESFKAPNAGADGASHKLVLDRVGAEPVLLVLGPDENRCASFEIVLPGIEDHPAFYRTLDDKQSHPRDAAWRSRPPRRPC